MNWNGDCEDDSERERYVALANQLKREYKALMAHLHAPHLTIAEIRHWVNRLMANLSMFAKHSEMMYLCRLILFVDETATGIEAYRVHLRELHKYNIDAYL
jgi:hypothetical protein